MNATLLDSPGETLETAICGENCPAVQRLERALEELRAEFRWQAGYWKSRHTDAVKRISQLQEELEESLVCPICGRLADCQEVTGGLRDYRAT